jgi:sulfate permease, SulP family
VLYLYRTMRPRVSCSAAIRTAPCATRRLHDLPTSEHIIVMRFDGSLYFANVPYFEDVILGRPRAIRRRKYILIVGDGINEIDGSGEEVIRHLAAPAGTTASPWCSAG